ncbi:MAG TPA: hypothetical protein DIT64_20670, partial [Verrucomicrobiales bacterium]|nr:hypothetical protein [Verrucomicrobiales bacterium]
SRVVDAGGCTQAAKAAGGAPGNFARKMKELEQCFGVTLLKPGAQGMTPTEEGMELYQIINHNLQRLGDFHRKCRGRPATVRLCAGSSMLHWWVAPRLTGIVGSLNGARLDLVARRVHERVPDLRKQEADFAIVRGEAVGSQLKSCPLLVVEHLLFVSRSLLKRLRLEAGDPRLVTKLPLALPAEGDVRTILERGLERAKARVTEVIQTASFVMAARAAAAREVAAILPHIAAWELPDAEFAAVAVPALGGHTQRLHLCWNPAHIRASAPAERVLPVLQHALAV